MQRGKVTAPPVAVANTDTDYPAETTRSTATINTVVAAASDVPDTPSVPENVPEATGATNAGKTTEPAPTATISTPAGATKSTTHTPSRQRADKAPTTARAGRATG